MDFHDDGVRRPRGRGEDRPAGGVVARRTGLGNGRNIRRGRKPYCGRDAERADLALPDERQAGHGVRKHHGNVAGDDIGQRGCASLVGHVDQFEPGFELEHFHQQMMGRPRPARSIGRLVPRLLCPLHEIGDGPDGQRRVDDQNERDSPQEGDQGKILGRVVGQVLSYGGADGERAAARRDQGIAVWRGLRPGGGAEHRAGARAIIDDDVPAEAFAEAGRDRAAQRIDRAAGGPWRDQGDLPGRIFLRAQPQWPCHGRTAERCDEITPPHLRLLRSGGASSRHAPRHAAPLLYSGSARDPARPPAQAFLSVPSIR